LRKQGVKEKIVENLGEEDKNKGQQDTNPAPLNLDSDRGESPLEDASADACANDNMSARKRRYISSSNSESEDLFISIKMGKPVLDDFAKEIFVAPEKGNDENFEGEKELIEDRYIRKEL